MSRWKVVPGIDYYFATTTIINWQYIFTAIPRFDVIIDSLKYCIKNKALHVHGYVIMPNHAHYLLSTENGENLSDVMRDFGTHTSRRITEFLEQEKRFDVLEVFRAAAQADGRGNHYKVWQDGFHPIAIESDFSFLRSFSTCTRILSEKDMLIGRNNGDTLLRGITSLMMTR